MRNNEATLKKLKYLEITEDYFDCCGVVNFINTKRHHDGTKYELSIGEI